MAPSKAKQVEVATRRAELTKLRGQGVPFDDPQILQLGYTSGKAASKDMCRTLDRAIKREALNTDQYRKLQETRLLSLITAIAPQVLQGELPAVEQTRKLISDLTDLFGLKMPIKVEASGPNGGPLELAPATVADLHRLIGIAGEPDDDAGEDEEALAYEDEDPDSGDEDADGDQSA